MFKNRKKKWSLPHFLGGVTNLRGVLELSGVLLSPRGVCTVHPHTLSKSATVWL